MSFFAWMSASYHELHMCWGLKLKVTCFASWMNITKQIDSHEFIGGENQSCMDLLHHNTGISGCWKLYIWPIRVRDLEDRIGLSVWLSHIKGTTPAFLSKLVIKLWRTITGWKNSNAASNTAIPHSEEVISRGLKTLRNLHPNGKVQLLRHNINCFITEFYCKDT